MNLNIKKQMKTLDESLPEKKRTTILVLFLYENLTSLYRTNILKCQRKGSET